VRLPTDQELATLTLMADHTAVSIRDISPIVDTPSSVIDYENIHHGCFDDCPHAKPSLSESGFYKTFWFYNAQNVVDSFDSIDYDLAFAVNFDDAHYENHDGSPWLKKFGKSYGSSLRYVETHTIQIVAGMQPYVRLMYRPAWTDVKHVNVKISLTDYLVPDQQYYMLSVGSPSHCGIYHDLSIAPGAHSQVDIQNLFMAYNHVYIDPIYQSFEGPKTQYGPKLTSLGGNNTYTYQLLDEYDPAPDIDEESDDY